MRPLLNTGHRCFFLGHHLYIRSFFNARIKWVCDPYLDTAIEREKNLKPLLSLQNLILTQPSKSISISFISPLKPNLNIPSTALKFLSKYPLIFKIFLPPHKSNSRPHVKLTRRAILLQNKELLLLNMSNHHRDVAERLVKLLMLTQVERLPIYLIDMLKFDLGLPHDYLSTLLLEFPDYFQICDMGFKDSSGSIVVGLELISWRADLAISVVEKRANMDVERGKRVNFSMNLPRGFDLEKKVMEWVDEWQSLPYISPYEDAFHLMPNSDQAEKWVVAVIHELLCLLVPKKTEMANIFSLGEFMGFAHLHIKRALTHFPGIFYISNKIKTQTVVLREEYRKNLLIEMHPLMMMRNKYIRLMNLVLRRGKPMKTGGIGHRKRSVSLKNTKKKDDPNRYGITDDED